MGWHRELLIGFDLETTGTDPREARIVTAAVIEVRGGQPMGHREWLDRKSVV
jgi:DNA polymerase-3 subunit epsilon